MNWPLWRRRLRHPIRWWRVRHERVFDLPLLQPRTHPPRNQMSAPSWPSDVVPEWYPTHDRQPDILLPRGVFDRYGPDGEVIETPTDHRMLWHLENRLALAPHTPYMQETYSLLLAYLQGNCRHHWLDYEAEEGYCEAHRQCLWCNSVEWTNA